MNIIEKLIPSVQTDCGYNGINGYVSCEALQKQTDDLRSTVKALIEYCIGVNDGKIEDIRFYEISVFIIQKVTGKSLEEIKAILNDNN